jgi:hypothetical protein
MSGEGVVAGFVIFNSIVTPECAEHGAEHGFLNYKRRGHTSNKRCADNDRIHGFPRIAVTETRHNMFFC